MMKSFLLRESELENLEMQLFSLHIVIEENADIINDGCYDCQHSETDGCYDCYSGCVGGCITHCDGGCGSDCSGGDYYSPW